MKKLLVIGSAMFLIACTQAPQESPAKSTRPAYKSENLEDVTNGYYVEDKRSGCLYYRHVDGIDPVYSSLGEVVGCKYGQRSVSVEHYFKLGEETSK